MVETMLHVSSTIPSQTEDTFLKDTSMNKDHFVPQELFTTNSLLEICNSFWTRSPGANKDVQPYLRGCKWSPDGTCCLSVVNRDGFHVMELPCDLYDGCPTRDRMISLLPAVIHVKESGLVYDFCWYPNMNSQYPETCSWISTKNNSPIQMWDAYDGSLRCSYRGYDAVDEMEPALSVTFINNGQKIVGGYKSCLRTFDVERPGRDFSEHRIKSPASCIAAGGNFLAVGSWNSKIQLFSVHDRGTYKSVGNLYSHTGGITHLMFTPDGSKLVSGARKDNNLCVWDLRYYKRPLNILKRCVTTSQRIYFDISLCGRYLVSGGTDGVIRIWDNKLTKWTEQYNVNRGDEENATFRFKLYNDCCNSISIHPSRPIIATGSGQYHILDPMKDVDECDISTISEDTSEDPQQISSRLCSTEQRVLDSINGNFTKDLETVPTNADEILAQDQCLVNDKSSANEVQVMATSKEISCISPNCSIDEDASTVIDTNSDSPPMKKRKCDNDINLTSGSKEIIETEISASILNPECFDDISSQEDINERVVADNLPSTEINKINQPNIQNKYLDDITERNIDYKSISQMEQECVCPAESSDQVTSPDPNNHSKIISEQYYNTNLKSNDEAQTVSSLINDQLRSISELATISELNTSDNRSLNLLKTSNPSAVQLNLISPNVNLSMIRSPSNVKKTIDSKYVLNNTLQSDKDHNDGNEKMKYSSFAENNLTFWWTGNVLKGNSQNKVQL